MHTLDELMAMTQTLKHFFLGAELVPIGDNAPHSVKAYGAFTWKEECFYHTLLGELPEPGIWTIGSTKEESWQLFDDQFQARIQPDGTLRELSKEEHKALASTDFDKNSFLENCKEYHEWQNRHGANGTRRNN
jgi:hypothetical protein